LTVPQRFYAIIIAAALSLSAPNSGAQGLQSGPSRPPQNATQSSSQNASQPGAPNGWQPGAPYRSRVTAATPPSATLTATTSTARPSPGIPATTPIPRPATAHSLLDEPATPAQIHLVNDQLSITATNASLSQVIRQVASDTGMQVEGNSRDERVFGSYGPGSPPEVLSALLYDSGYNVLMIGATANGAPRRLLLTTRTAGSTAPSTAAPTRSDEDDDEAPPEQLPPPMANPAPLPASSGPPAPGQPKTPQQMLEELQRMHQGQQPTDLPHDNN
jgi:hypothetical protein